MKTPWTFTAKAGGDLEILLYDEIGESLFGESTTAKNFSEDLKTAGAVSRIHLRVNSPGGNVFDGLAIYNTLLAHGATVTAQVDGIAASIAGVILMAASKISIAENALIMIHNPFVATAGDAEDMRKMAETLDKVKSSMVTAYRRHAKKSKNEIAAMMDAETWMDADEAMDAGFADRVLSAGEDAGMAAAVDLSKFRKVPQQIAARFAAKAGSERGIPDGERLRLVRRLELLKRLPDGSL
jgi:ATP-dependent Clp endopeptidase proteolytic subunit ClpP